MNLPNQHTLVEAMHKTMESQILEAYDHEVS